MPLTSSTVLVDRAAVFRSAMAGLALQRAAAPGDMGPGIAATSPDGAARCVKYAPESQELLSVGPGAAYRDGAQLMSPDAFSVLLLL
jgi:hypothetical protein